jgi:hypothetical protein
MPIFYTFAPLSREHFKATFSHQPWSSPGSGITTRNKQKEEGRMATSEQYFSLVRTSKSSWVAVHINHSEPAPDGATYSREPESAILRNGASAPARLFADSVAAHVAFSERFPRLTIAMIALGLFAVSITAEIECLRQAGFFWR